MRIVAVVVGVVGVVGVVAVVAVVVVFVVVDSHARMPVRTHTRTRTHMHIVDLMVWKVRRGESLLK